MSLPRAFKKPPEGWERFDELGRPALLSSDRSTVIVYDRRYRSTPFLRLRRDAHTAPVPVALGLGWYASFSQASQRSRRAASRKIAILARRVSGNLVVNVFGWVAKRVGRTDVWEVFRPLPGRVSSTMSDPVIRLIVGGLTVANVESYCAGLPSVGCIPWAKARIVLYQTARYSAAARK